MNERETIGVVIQERRKHLKIAQQDLAEIAQVSERTLRDLERGMGNPSLKTLLSVTEVLGLELKLLVKQAL